MFVLINITSSEKLQLWGRAEDHTTRSMNKTPPCFKEAATRQSRNHPWQTEQQLRTLTGWEMAVAPAPHG